MIVASFALTSCATEQPNGTQPIGSPGQATSATPDSTASAVGDAHAGRRVMEVTADELRLRVSAGTDGPIIGALVRGDVVLVTSEATGADGYNWHEVMDTTGKIGWVAAGDGADAWLHALGDQPPVARLFQFGYACDVSPPVRQPSVTIMEDGQVIFSQHALDPEGWLTWQLTEEGLAQFREDVLASPLLVQPGDYTPQLRANVGEPPGHGLCLYRFATGDAANAVVVTSVSWFGDEEESAFYEPAPERRALDRLAQSLGVIHELLDAEAWAQPEPRPYVGRSYLLWLVADAGAVPAGTPYVGDVQFPIDGPLETFGDAMDGFRCGHLTLAQAMEFAWLLRDRGIDLRLDSLNGPSLALDSGSVSILLVPRTPDGSPACSDAF